ncbi:hypothetical protein MXB_128 [Myxobolus squamalis]|nr:hypothetical protein MXB_128 [Myxobolus squamalis]
MVIYEPIYYEKANIDCGKNFIRISNAVTDEDLGIQCMLNGTNFVMLDPPVNYDLRIDIISWCPTVSSMILKWMQVT